MQVWAVRAHETSGGRLHGHGKVTANVGHSLSLIVKAQSCGNVDSAMNKFVEPSVGELFPAGGLGEDDDALAGLHVGEREAAVSRTMFEVVHGEEVGLVITPRNVEGVEYLAGVVPVALVVDSDLPVCGGIVKGLSCHSVDIDGCQSSRKSSKGTGVPLPTALM